MRREPAPASASPCSGCGAPSIPPARLSPAAHAGRPRATMGRPMTRVLILTASYGSGHLAAAGALAAALREAGADAVVMDHFREFVCPAFARISQALYMWILRRAPALWGLGYGLGDHLACESPFALGMPRIGRDRLARPPRPPPPRLLRPAHPPP